MDEEVVFLGHEVNATGLYTLHEKVYAIQEAPTPSNVTELKAYLGLLNYYYYGPVHKLLQKHTRWQWGEAKQNAFGKKNRNYAVC